ncbi:uncharacterized protein ARMOST_17875 [Armillaria ostoyae]|uniref:Uncharacterized protein n=1 Tax=Armillaria ostoyae TaxID=47428 RepID=A0A284S076_ARMOS|nr:uncharacterized protein ARMOST_17875 [Armillaria ostoyae]
MLAAVVGWYLSLAFVSPLAAFRNQFRSVIIGYLYSVWTFSVVRHCLQGCPVTKVSKPHDFEDTPFQVTLRTTWVMLFAALWMSWLPGRIVVAF